MEAGLNIMRPIAARHGAAATSQRLASAVAIELLQAGGSAVDAALGANAMLSLIEPHMCGPGGDLFALVWEPDTRSLHGLNASGRAPRGQSLADLRTRLAGQSSIPIHGVHSATVPGAVRGWQALHERFGRLSLAQIYAPVIAHARFVELEDLFARIQPSLLLRIFMQAQEGKHRPPALTAVPVSYTHLPS